MNKQKLMILFASQQSFHSLIVGIMLPVLVLLFQSRGLNLQDVGLVMAVWVGSTAMLEIPLGGVADRYGRKSTYLWSLVVNLAGVVALYFASGLGLILLAACLLGSARAIYSGTLDAWFYDSFQRADGHLTYHQALSVVNICVTVGLAAGAFLGGWLPDAIQSEPFDFTGQFNINLLIVGGATLCLFLFTVLLIQEDVCRSSMTGSDAKKQPGYKGQMRKALRASMTQDVLKPLMQTMLIFGVVLSSLENFWQPFLASIIQGSDYGTFFFGVVSALYFLMAAAASLFSVKFLRAFAGSHRMLLLATRIIAGGVLLVLAMTKTLEAFAVSYLVFFFFFTMGINSERVLLNENTEDENRSTMISISSFTMMLGGMASSLLFGYISEVYGISMNWMICGGLLILSSLLYLRIPSEGPAVEA